MGTSRRALTALVLLALFSINCGLAQPVIDRIQNSERLASLTGLKEEPTRRRPTPRPTFTPTPSHTDTPTATSTPTLTPIPTETATPLPTETPLPTDTPDTTVRVSITQQMNIRTGPSTAYNLAGSAPPGSDAVVTGRNADNTWLQVEYPPGSGSSGWVLTELVQVAGNLEFVNVVDVAAPPTATPAPPTPTSPPEPTATPNWAFKIREQGNREFQRTNASFISGIVLISDGGGTPLGGYKIVGVNSSGEPYTSAESTWQLDALNGLEGYIKQGNLKFEPPGGYNDETWTIYVADSAGSQVSAPLSLHYSSDPNQRYWDFIWWAP